MSGLTRQEIVTSIIGSPRPPRRDHGQAFAPSNIALCKYWGKRDAGLNLPVNSSLSISLGRLGTTTAISGSRQDEIWLNDKKLAPDDPFALRLKEFLALFRHDPHMHFHLSTKNNIPTAAGLASSASGYAALVLALDDFFKWNLPLQMLSILARLGSGSASRSLYHGFVEWHRGERADGMDSFAETIPTKWPELRIAVLSVSTTAKAVGSTAGMNRTVQTSTLYTSWPKQAQQDLASLRRAINDKNFTLLGKTAERNALAMHATMIAAEPPLLYWLPETVEQFRKIWRLRDQGLSLYFTIDAGANVKVLFQEADLHHIKEQFPGAEIVAPFQALK